MLFHLLLVANVAILFRHIDHPEGISASLKQDDPREQKHGIPHDSSLRYDRSDFPARLLGDDHKMGPPVLLIAIFGMLITERLLFAVADEREARGADPQIHQKVHDRLGPPLAERQIIFFGSPLVA